MSYFSNLLERYS